MTDIEVARMIAEGCPHTHEEDVMGMRPERYVVIDVESVGLHGQAFAWGAVVIDGEGRELLCAGESCDPHMVEGTPDGRAWVEKHVPRLQRNVVSPRAMRDAFWAFWREQSETAAAILADVPWPVEANFLSACVADEPEKRAWDGPYPLLDIASVRLAAGLSPLEVCQRLENERPAHNPICDARQSARLFVEAMKLSRQAALPA